MSKIFYYGQIKHDCRGPLAVIVTPGNDPNRLDNFMYSITEDNEELMFLMRGRGVRYSPVRAYFGVSREVGENLLRFPKEAPANQVDLEALDRLVVNPIFLKEAS